MLCVCVCCVCMCVCVRVCVCVCVCAHLGAVPRARRLLLLLLHQIEADPLELLVLRATSRDLLRELPNRADHGQNTACHGASKKNALLAVSRRIRSPLVPVSSFTSAASQAATQCAIPLHRTLRDASRASRRASYLLPDEVLGLLGGAALELLRRLAPLLVLQELCDAAVLLLELLLLPPLPDLPRRRELLHVRFARVALRQFSLALPGTHGLCSASERLVRRGAGSEVWASGGVQGGVGWWGRGLKMRLSSFQVSCV